MSRMMLGWVGVLAVAFCLLPAGVFAQQEHGGKEHGGAGTAAPAEGEEQGGTETAAPAAQPAPAPAVQEEVVPLPEAPVLPPALKPITITFSGSLLEVNAQDVPPRIVVEDRYGVKKEMDVPAEATVTAGGAPKMVGDLKAGDALTVEYLYDVATGKRTAQSITVGEGPASS